MQHFPIFLNVKDQHIVVAGGGAAAMAKLRLLLKTEAQITVIAPQPATQVVTWEEQFQLTILRRHQQPGDAKTAALFYAAHDDDTLDQAAAKMARTDGALVNWVDNLAGSDFITPAIVDRDPVTIAIGTEGAAPVLARAIKRDLEESLPQSLGTLARIGKNFRHMVDRLPMGRIRRDFWSAFYFQSGPKALADGGDAQVQDALNHLLNSYSNRAERQAHVDFIGAGPGDPELLTLKARTALHEADVVFYDPQIPAAILELARREADLIEGTAPSLAPHLDAGLQIAVLQPGAGVKTADFHALFSAGHSCALIPGVAAAPTSQILPFRNKRIA